MNGNNGWLPKGMIAGSHKDMTIAYVFRVFTVIAQGAGVLILWALFNLGVTIRDDTRDIKKEWPEIKKDIGELKIAHAESKQALKVAAEIARKELMEAEQRVKNEFQEQIRKGRIITNQNRQP